MNIKSLMIKNKEITIISNNCFAGMFYKHYGLRFNSPTIGLFIRSQEYIKFLQYLPEILEGGYILTEKQTDVKWPVGNIHTGRSNVDIEINFMHYTSFEEAARKWNYRLKRVDLKRLIIFFMQTPFFSQKDLDVFKTITYGTKVFAYDSAVLGEVALENVIVKKTNAFHWKPDFTWDFRVMLKDTEFKQIVNEMKSKE